MKNSLYFYKIVFIICLFHWLFSLFKFFATGSPNTKNTKYREYNCLCNIEIWNSGIERGTLYRLKYHRILTNYCLIVTLLLYKLNSHRIFWDVLLSILRLSGWVIGLTILIKRWNCEKCANFINTFRKFQTLTNF